MMGCVTWKVSVNETYFHFIEYPVKYEILHSEGTVLLYVLIYSDIPVCFAEHHLSTPQPSWSPTSNKAITAAIYVNLPSSICGF
jgi:hypothetical protein